MKRLIPLLLIAPCRRQPGAATRILPSRSVRWSGTASSSAPSVRSRSSGLPSKRAIGSLAGDVIVELDSRRIVRAARAGRGDPDLAAARLAEVVRGFRYEEIDQARAQLAEAEAALIQHQPNLERARKLVTDGVEPQSVLDTAEANQTAAAARRDAARSSLEKFLNGATVEELDQARAELARTEAEVAKLTIDAERMIVTAPRDGTIDALPFRVGDEPPSDRRWRCSSPMALPLPASMCRPSCAPERLPAQRCRSWSTVSISLSRERIRMISAEAAFTPYYALTERDRGHFAYLAEIDLVGDAARDLPTGLPVEVTF